MQDISFKKLLLIGALLLSVPVLSTTAVYAADCPAGCDCPRDPDTGEFSADGIMGQMEVFGEASRVRDKAQAQQIVKQPDNTAGLTCFDRQLALTAKLGSIFSDKFPTNLPAASGIFRQPDADQIPWDYKTGGMSQLLAKGLKNTLTGTNGNNGLLQRYAGNFTRSLSFDLGATNDLGFMNQLSTIFEGPNNALSGIFSTANGYMSQINNAFNSLQNLQNLTSGQLATTVGNIANAVGLAGVVTAINQVNTLLTQIEGFRTQFNNAYASIQNTANNMSSMVQSYIGQFAGSLLGNYLGRIISGLLGGFGINTDSMLGQGGAEACDRIGKLWGDKEWPGGQALSKAITGIGSDKGVPYFKLQDMLGSAINGICPDGGDCDDLLQSIGSDGNAGVLNKLQGLIGQGGTLSAPGISVTWPKAENIFTRKNASLSAIIEAIQNGP